MNKIARIHVNQHVIKANAKYGENNPVFTIKQGGKNTYAYNVRVVGEMELVYSPHKQRGITRIDFVSVSV